MRFLIISDVHAREKVAVWSNRLIEERGLDAVIVLGDITHFGPPAWAGEFLARFSVPVYAVPGNCDPPGTIEFIARHATLLHGSKMKVGHYTFGGLGGSNPTIFNTPFEMSEEEIMESLRPVMEKGMVLVTHCPPFGVHDLVVGNRHTGSTAIKTLVEEFRPIAVLSGHIHEARGILKQDGCLYLNPGAAKDGYSAILELNGEPRAELMEKASLD